MTATPDLSCRGVAKAFATRTVLHDVDLAVPAGTLTAILGASGSGKTTLLRVIVGFLAPDRGTVTVGGSVVAKGGAKAVPPDKRAIGYVAQEGALFPHLNVAENVGFGLPRPTRRGRRRIVEVLELVGLSFDYAARRPHELSGGEQRRVALARSLAPRPGLVLLDEPFSGLDASLRASTREAVLHALGAEGTTAVMVTHDQGEALSMGREVAVLRGGHLVQTATPSALYRTPADLELARFVGEAVVLSGRSRGPIVSCALGELHVHHGGQAGSVKVMIRPEQVRVRRLTGEGFGDEATAPVPGTPARVLGITSYGPDCVIRLALLKAPDTTVTARTFSYEVPDVGERVRLSVAGSVVTYPGSTAGGAPDPALDAASAQSRPRVGLGLRETEAVPGGRR